MSDSQYACRRLAPTWAAFSIAPRWRWPLPRPAHHSARGQEVSVRYGGKSGAISAARTIWWRASAETLENWGGGAVSTWRSIIRFRWALVSVRAPPQSWARWRPATGLITGRHGRSCHPRGRAKGTRTTSLRRGTADSRSRSTKGSACSPIRARSRRSSACPGGSGLRGRHQEGRAVLPGQYSRADAIHNLQRATVLAAQFFSGKTDFHPECLRIAGTNPIGLP